MTPGELATLLALVRVLVEEDETRAQMVVSFHVVSMRDGIHRQAIANAAVAALDDADYYMARDLSARLAAIDRAILAAEARE